MPVENSIADLFIKSLIEELVLLRREVSELKTVMVERQEQVQKKIEQEEEVLGPSKLLCPVTNNLEDKISATLQELNIPASILGYKYLRDAIMIAYNDVDIYGSVTKVFYPKVAEMHKTLPTRVERAIRHAIETSYDKNYLHPFYQKNFSNRKPTNSAFIAILADNIKRDEQTQ